MNEPLPHSDTDLIVRLLDEFITGQELGRPVDRDDLERRAGARAPELRQHISVACRVAELAPFLTGASEPEGTRSFGRFRTRRLLGTGGHSSVFLAHDPNLGRDIALKVLSQPSRPDSVDSLAEARALAQFDHPSVVKVFEVGQEDRSLYIAMEHVSGADLRSVMRAMQSITDEGSQRPNQPADQETQAAKPSDDHDPECLRIAQKLHPIGARCQLIERLARALAYCHNEGVVHRDVKPENVLLDRSLTPKLIDFGLAREESKDEINVTQGLRGTPSYFAPEQVDRGTGGASAASDQFSLGSVMYELLTLVHPFREATLNGTMSAISAARPVSVRRRNPAVPLDAELICTQCLERNPERRYASMSAMADDLNAFLNHRAISVRPNSAARTLGLVLLRNKRLLAAAAVAAALTILAVGGVAAASTALQIRSFQSAVQQQQEGLTSLDEPAEFRSLFDGIRTRWTEAHDLDQTLQGRLTSDSATTVLRDLWHAGVERLDHVLMGPPRRIEPRKRVNASDEFFRVWGPIASSVGLSAPPELTGFEYPVSGTVKLPDYGQLERVDPHTLPTRRGLVPVGERHRQLQSGTYRFSSNHEGESVETEFLLSTKEPRWAPALNVLRSDVQESMVSITEARLSLPRPDGTVETVPYEPFGISRTPITWGDLRATFTEGELKPLLSSLGDAELTDEEPACIYWVFAAEYASRVGARLPTPIELLAATRSGLVELTPGVRCEWTSAEFASNITDRFAVPNALAPDLNNVEFDKCLELRAYDSLIDDFGFRVARTL